MTHSKVVLTQDDLHQSLSDPILESMDFLNEIMDRYPQAISFGPGAPHMGLVEELDVSRYIEIYAKYLKEDKHMSFTQVRRCLYQYGPSQGQINNLIADALRQDENIDVRDNDIIVTVGCQEALFLILKSLFPQGSEAMLAVVNPSYVGIVGAARSLDIDILPIDEAADSLDFATLIQHCEDGIQNNKKVRAIYVAPNFSNPSGTLMSLDAREKLLALAAYYNFLIVEDNAYGFTAEPGEEIPTLKALDKCARVIHVGTFAKICLPGVRVGFAVADQIVHTSRGEQTLANQLASVKSMLTINTSPVCQAIIGGMLLDCNKSLKVLGQEKRNFYLANLNHLLAMLEKYFNRKGEPELGVRWNAPKGGFFVTLRLPISLTEKDLLLSAEKYGVLWTPMSFFDLNKSRKNEIRLSCSYLDEAKIEQGVFRLVRFLKDKINFHSDAELVK